MDVAQKPRPALDCKYFLGFPCRGVNLPLNGVLKVWKTISKGSPKVSLTLTTTFPIQNGIFLELAACDSQEMRRFVKIGSKMSLTLCR